MKETQKGGLSLIDLHCHILPGIDDGPQSLTECIDMAYAAVSSGISHVFATPHHKNGRFNNNKINILEHVFEINRFLLQEDIPLTVYPGQELRVHREIFKSIELDEILTLNNKGKYLLLELPSTEVPSYTFDVIYELLLKEIKPIIVHPERNLGCLEDSSLLFEMVRSGALIQLTSGSIMGHFGKKVKSFSEKIIEHNFVHFVSSDAHNNGPRRFTLKEAYETITKRYGSNFTYYFRENAELILRGEDINIMEPVPIRKRVFGIFQIG